MTATLCIAVLGTSIASELVKVCSMGAGTLAMPPASLLVTTVVTPSLSAMLWLSGKGELRQMRRQKPTKISSRMKINRGKVKMQTQKVPILHPQSGVLVMHGVLLLHLLNNTALSGTMQVSSHQCLATSGLHNWH